MKATEAKLLDFLKKSPQFVIPIYQRTYSWTEKECRQLWDDILRAGSNDRISPCTFVGSSFTSRRAVSSVTQSGAVARDRRPAAPDHRDAAARGPWPNAIGDGRAVGRLLSAEAPQLLPAQSRERASGTTSCSSRRPTRPRSSPSLANQEQPKEPSVRVTQNFELFEELDHWPRRSRPRNACARDWRSWWSWTSRSAAIRTTRSSSSRA